MGLLLEFPTYYLNSRLETEHNLSSDDRPTILVTNGEGINAPGLQALVRTLVRTNHYNVLVCAPEPPKLGFGYSITSVETIAAKRAKISGATAYTFPGSSSDCVSLGLSKKLFPSVPDLVLSGTKLGNSCGDQIISSGTVAGAREAFFLDVPSVTIAYDWVWFKSNNNDFLLAANACLPIISAIFAAIKANSYPRSSYLVINLPTDVRNHKGYKLTKRGKCIVKKELMQGGGGGGGGGSGNILSEFLNNMQINSSASAYVDDPLQTNPFFRLELTGDQVAEADTDYYYLQEGYITVTPLGTLIDSEINCPMLEEWFTRLTA